MLDYTGRCAQTHTHKDQSLEAHAATSAYTHTERQIPTLIDLPVSSDLPLVSLKELEWLPACLYFLNLSMTRQALQHTSTNRHTHTHTYIYIYIRPRFTAECQSVVAIVTAATWGLSTGFIKNLTSVSLASLLSCYFPPMIRDVTIPQRRPGHFVRTQSHPTCRCCLTWACRGWWWWRWWPARRTQPPWQPWWASRPAGCLLGRQTKEKYICSACTALHVH